MFRTIPHAAATGSRCFVLSYSRLSATFIDFRLLGFGPSPARRLNWLLWPLLTSCSSLLLRLPNSIYHRLQDLPWYSHAPSPRATASFTGNDSVQLLDVRLCCILVLVACLMRFLFVSSGICLHLPSDSTSRWTPLVFGYILPAVGWIRDFHPLERALAGRTTKSPAKQGFPTQRVRLKFYSAAAPFGINFLMKSKHEASLVNSA